MIGESTIPLVRATGGPFERGHAHGVRLAGSLKAFVEDDLCRLNRLLAAPTTLEALAPRLAAYGEHITAGTPDLMIEIAGLAAGADLTLNEALLLQCRREIMGYTRIPTSGDCTTYSRVGAGPAVLAQTVDLNGNLDDVLSVLRTGNEHDGQESLILSFGGLLGYLGVNGRGLAVGINLVLGGTWGPGVPPYLVIRHLLDEAGTVAEALDLLAGLHIASSRTFTLCDAGSVACVEVLDNELRVTRGESSVHTNHFLDPGFARQDDLNVFALNSSRQRLDAGRALLDSLPGTADAEQHLRGLAAAPICVPDRGNIRSERTVAAVVLYPESGELHLRPGDPSLSSTQVFSLR